MQKINDFITKHGWIILCILILLYIFKKKSIEPMVCDLNRPNFNYIRTELLHLIEEYDLREKELNVIDYIFNLSKFPNGGYVRDNKSLEEFIKINNIESKKDDMVGAINVILNNNRMWDNVNEYKVTLKSKLSQIRHIWLLDKLLTDLKCSLNYEQLKSIKDQIKTIMKDKPMKLCNQSDLVGYCSAVSKDPTIGTLTHDELVKEKLALDKGKFKETTTTNKSKNFKLVSIKDSVSKFGVGYYPEPINTILVNMLGHFEEKYSRKLDNYDREDILKLTKLYVPVLKTIIDKKISSSECSSNEKKYIEEEYKNNQELFYLLKHQYKLISIYDLINSSLEDVNDKNLAYKCCVDTNSSNNSCFRFGSNSNSRPIVYGFNKFGYAKNTPCALETKKHLFDLQTKSLEDRLAMNENWSFVNKEVKAKFYENMVNLINYFIAQKVNENIKTDSVSSLLYKIKLQNVNLILPENIDTTKIVVDVILDDETNKVIESIQLATTVPTIRKIANNYGLSDSDFDFFSLGKNFEKIKFAAIKLIELRRLLLVYKANNSRINNVILKMLAVAPTEDNYYNILLKGGVQPRFHQNIIDHFYKMLTEIKLIDIEKLDLSSNPFKVIKYQEKLFPNSKDMDVCNIYGLVLKTLRNKRNISPYEYVKFNEEISKFCKIENEDEYYDKPILYIDNYGKLIEVQLKNITDYKNNKVFVLVTTNSNRDIEILNYNTRLNRVNYSGIILKNNNLIFKNDLTKSGSLVDIVSVSLDNNEKKIFKTTKVIIDKESINKDDYSINSSNDTLLSNKKLNIEIDNNNRNLVTLYDNYFQFN